MHRVIVRAFALAKARLKLPELPQRDLGDAHVKRLRERRAMHRLLIPVRRSKLLVMRCHVAIACNRRPILAHGESSGFDAHEPHADGVRDRLPLVGIQCGQRHEQQSSEDGEYVSHAICSYSDYFSAFAISSTSLIVKRTLTMEQPMSS